MTSHRSLRSRSAVPPSGLVGRHLGDGAPLTHCAVAKVIGFAELRVSLGYEAAHAVMQQLAFRLEQSLPHCILGRIGRTTIEFGFSHAGQPSVLREDVAEVRRALQAPLHADGVPLSLTVACGVARLGAGRIDDQALDRAAAALTRAQPATDLIGLAEEEGARDAISDLEIARALTRAIAADALDLHYQPKLHCRTDAIESVEALLRWTDAAHGAMPIDRVVAVAERIGIIDALTDWVVARALRDRTILAAAGHAPTLYVNLSGRLLSRRDYIAALIGRVAGSDIGFEITETAIIDDPADAIANVVALSHSGIRIAIDDYGSGLSSLSYLKQLPAHELKIDRAFIQDLITSHRDPLLVRSSIDLAHALDMQVTAEGVDDAMTLSLLRVMGCDIIQGFLISRPLPLPQLIAFLDAGADLAGFGRATHALPTWPKADDAAQG